MEHILAVALAVLFDLLLGELPNKFHPVVWIGKWVSFTSGIAQRIKTGSARRDVLLGATATISGIILFSLPLFLAMKGLSLLPQTLRILLSALLLKPVFALTALRKAATQIQAALVAADLEEARRLTAWHLVSRDTSKLTLHQVISAVIESVTENFCDSFTAPLLAFFVGGLPLVWAYRFVNTSDAMIGYRTPQWETIGKFAALLDDLFNWIPARISGFLLCLAAPFVRGNFQSGLRLMVQDHARTASPNSGWPMAAAAGIFDIKLEKVGNYVLNQAGETPKIADIGHTNRLVTAAAFLNVVLVVLIIGWFNSVG